MASSYAEIQDIIEQILQDTGAATYDTTETGVAIQEGLKELARYDPHLVDVIFQIESRKGTDTGSTGTALTDDTKSQFLSTDATLEKVIHNTTDHTWAVIKTDSSSSVQVLTASIMASGENYEMYNKRCRNSKQIYIGDVSDYLWVDSVEYPIGTKRGFTIYDYILEIDVNTVKDSNLNVTSKPDLDVLVRFAKSHKLCTLTDVDGLVKTAGAAAATSLLVDNFTNAETIEIGDELHIEDHRSLYTVTKGILLANQTEGSAGVTFHFTPSLEAAAEANKAVTFRKSSLQIHHEEMFCSLVAARIAISKGSKFLLQLETALTTLTNVSGIINTMTAEITQAGVDLAAGRTAAALTPAIITKAETAIGLIGNQINPAIAQFHTGQALINEINKGGAGVPTSYANYATTALNNARAFADQARVNLQQAVGDESIARTYTGLASGELSQATAQLNQASGYIREITSRLNIASSFRLYQEWGERKLFEVKAELETLRPPRTKRSYPRD